MPAYDVGLTAVAERTLERLPRPLREGPARAISGSESSPRPRGYGPVVTRPGCYRIRVGDWRVVYQVDDASHLVTVVETMARQSDYRPR